MYVVIYNFSWKNKTKGDFEIYYKNILCRFNLNKLLSIIDRINMQKKKFQIFYAYKPFQL